MNDHMIPAAEKEFYDTVSREEFEAAISELTPDERAKLLKMFRQYKAEKAQSRVTKENGRVNK